MSLHNFDIQELISSQKTREIPFLQHFAFFRNQRVSIFAISPSNIELIKKNNEFLEKEGSDFLQKFGNYERFMVFEKDYDFILNQIIEKLRLNARGLSMGNIDKNLQLTSYYLLLAYQFYMMNPFYHPLLQIILQSVGMIYECLLLRPKYTFELIRSTQKYPFPYEIKQGFLSSLFFIAFSIEANFFTPNQKEELFFTSFIKDIGNAFIPPLLFSKYPLTKEEKEQMNRHQKYSLDLIRGKLVLSQNTLKMIESHHITSSLYDNTYLNYCVYGAELFFINTCDIYAAMISPRPFRPPEKNQKIFQVLKDSFNQTFSSELKIFGNFIIRNMSNLS